MRGVNRQLRLFNNLRDDTVGNIEGAGLLAIWIDAFYLKRSADQPSIAQHDFSYALPDGRDLRRGSPEFEGEGSSIAERHIFVPFPLKFSFLDCPGNQSQRNNDCWPGWFRLPEREAGGGSGTECLRFDRLFTIAGFTPFLGTKAKAHPEGRTAVYRSGCR